MRFRLLLGALAGLAFGLALAGPTGARAQDVIEDQDFCHAECIEARRVCHRAAHAAHRVCEAGCEDAVESAIRRAHRVCREEELGPEECGRLVRHAVAAALEICRKDCREAFERARARCAEEVAECRRACADPPPCVQECFSELRECRAELGECQQECREEARQGLARCRELLANGATPEQFARCVKHVERRAERCNAQCHAELPCGANLRSCSRECRPDQCEPDPGVAP